VEPLQPGTGRLTDRERRRFSNILINPRFQLRYILSLTALGTLLIVIYAVLFYGHMRESYAVLVELSPMADETRARLSDALHATALRLGLISGGFLVAVSSLGLLFTHRTAGPLYHFKRVCNEIKDGKRQARIQLRPGDDFQDVARSFNDMMDSLTRDR
jgi:hypothetical protein